MSGAAVARPSGRAWWGLVLGIDVIIVALLPYALYLAAGLTAVLALHCTSRQPHRALATVALGQPLIWNVAALAGVNASVLFVDQLLLLIPLAVASFDYVSDWPKSRLRLWPEDLSAPWNSVLFWAAAFAIVLFFGQLETPTPVYGQGKFILFTIRNLLFLFAAGWFLQRGARGLSQVGRAVQFLRWILAFALIIAVLGLWNTQSNYWPVGTRLSVLDLNPIWFARYLGVGLLATWTLVALKRMKWTTAWLIAAVLIPPFYLAGSRGPLLGLLVSVTFFLLSGQTWNTPLRRALLLFVPFAGLAAVVWTALQGMPGGIESVFSHSASNVARLMMLKIAFEALSQPGLLGLGTGAYAHLVGVGDIRFYPHNIFLEVFLENGLLGILVLCGFFWASARIWLRSRWSVALDSDRRQLVRFAATWWVFSLVNAQLSGDLPGNEHLYLAAGALAAWAAPPVKADER